MSEVSVSEFCERLIRSRLILAVAVEEAVAQAKLNRTDEMSAREFADWLVTRQLLSQFHADSLMQGYTRFFVDDFKLIDRIGSGRMAGVFHAVHKLGMPIALKILPPKLARNPDLLARFQREAKLARLLHHPHIVKTYHAGCSDGLHYIAMEFLEGETLEDRLRDRKRLSPSEVLELAEQALIALQHVYKKGLVHRDVKPANLMLVPLPDVGDGRPRSHTVKLLDVGLGRMLVSEDESADVSPDLTKRGDVIGTPAYTAPEQHADSHAADMRSDLYSLGCVLYECLMGRRPFEDRNPVQVIIKHATQMPSDLVLEGYPRTQALQQWLWQLLAKKKSERFRTPNEAIKALRKLPEGPTQVLPRIEAPTIPRKRKSWEDASERPERTPAWFYVSVSLGVLCPTLLMLYTVFRPPVADRKSDSAKGEPSGIVDVSQVAREPVEPDPIGLHQNDGVLAETKSSPQMFDQYQVRSFTSVQSPTVPTRTPESGSAEISPESRSGQASSNASPTLVVAGNTSPATPRSGITSKIAPSIPYDPDPLEPIEAGPRTRWQAIDSEFTVISSLAAPRAAFKLQRENGNLELIVEVACEPTQTVEVHAGLSATNKKLLTQADAISSRLPDGMRFEFRLASNDLVKKEVEWSKLRMGLAAVWKETSNGFEVQRERMLHVDYRAVHADMSTNEQDWAAFDLRAHEQHIADVRQKIVLSVRQPMEGKATIVIEDSQGNRIRNLVSAKPLPEGDHPFEWDGLDENQAPVKPGEYRWRSIHHAGIRPSYQFMFGNGGSPTVESWGPDHTMFSAVAANKDLTFLAAPSRESGQDLVAIDNQGMQLKTFESADGHNHSSVALAADDRHLYVLYLAPTDWNAHHGYASAKSPNRQGKERVTLSRYDIASGNNVPWDAENVVSVGEFAYGPDSSSPKRKPGKELGGAVVYKGKLYVSLNDSNAVRVLDTTTGKMSSEFPIPEPGPICAGPDGLFVASTDKITHLNPDSGALASFASVKGLRPGGIACDDAGELYVTDDGTQQIRVFDRGGTQVRMIGNPGGRYEGAYDRQRFVHPLGLAIGSDGKLWVTEGRMDPKRVSACDRRTGKVLIEKLGPAGYGGGGGGIDSGDPTQWILQNVLWKLDHTRKTAEPQSILLKQGHLGGMIGGAMHYRFYRHQGRTFVIGMGALVIISELMPDGHLRDLAFMGMSHGLWLMSGRNLPVAYLEACRGVIPAGSDPLRGGWGLLWVDRNGDGALQAAEFDIAPASDMFANGGWGRDQFDLTLRVTCIRDKRPVLVTLPLQGFHPSGAPKYPSLSTAVAQAKYCTVNNSLGGDSTVDRFGNMLILDDPLRSIAPDGRTLWTYPNHWNGVHGSHTAPLPQRGEFQGALFFLGTARLDDRSDVFVVNGNHGRFFVMTGDGMYLDEMFADVRMQAAGDENMIGGECFGGCFARGETDGIYYLQARGGRVYQIHGFDKIQRQEGTLTVSNAQRAAAQRSQVRGATEKVIRRDAVIPVAPSVDKLPNWFSTSDSPTAQWTSAQIRLAHDGQHLFASWYVWDKSPWLNAGKDWQMLFKTGDSVDLQLGTDPNADPQRSEPVPGDIRLLIAPFQGQNVAVLYRPRVSRGPKKAAKFSSPWRTETVDDVRVLSTVQIKVQVQENESYRVFATVPLADLGLTRISPQSLKADFGVIFSNPEGTENVLRAYWSNPATGLVNDVPGEIMLTPRLWGQIRFDGPK